MPPRCWLGSISTTVRPSRAAFTAATTPLDVPPYTTTSNRSPAPRHPGNSISASMPPTSQVILLIPQTMVSMTLPDSLSSRETRSAECSARRLSPQGRGGREVHSPGNPTHPQPLPGREGSNGIASTSKMPLDRKRPEEGQSLMTPTFSNSRVSIVVTRTESLPYDHASFEAILRAALEQDHPAIELLVVDSRGSEAARDFVPAGADASRIRHIPGKFANRAAMYNAALNVATGDALLLVLNEQAQVLLKRSAVQTMLMAARRCDGPAVGLVYADYERVGAAGANTEVHLLDWHAGRLRETFDLGSAVLLPVAALRDIGGFDESYDGAELYDARLRLGARHRLVHISNRFRRLAMLGLPRRLGRTTCRLSVGGQVVPAGVRA